MTIAATAVLTAVAAAVVAVAVTMVATKEAVAAAATAAATVAAAAEERGVSMCYSQTHLRPRSPAFSHQNHCVSTMPAHTTKTSSNMRSHTWYSS
jgi:hypothetical protein